MSGLLGLLFSPAGKLIGGVVLIGIIFGGVYLWGRHDGRAGLAGALQDDRITILKDGKAIDDEVLAGDDPYLCAVLGGCVPDDAGGD